MFQKFAGNIVLGYSWDLLFKLGFSNF